MADTNTPIKRKHTARAIVIGAGLALLVITFLYLADSGKIRGRRIITFYEKPFTIGVEKKFMGFTLSRALLDFPIIERFYPEHSWRVTGRTSEGSFRVVFLGEYSSCSEFGQLNFDLSVFEGRLAAAKTIPPADQVDAVLLSFVNGCYKDSPAGSLEELWDLPSSKNEHGP